jgi:hypothetical protein
MDLINFKRQLKLDLYEESNQISWEVNLPWWFNISRVKRRILNLKKSGGILTGSRALQGYRWNDKKVIGRRSNDWDFILTREQLWNFFKLEKIHDLDLDSNVYSINKSLLTFYDSYSDNPDDNTYIFNGKIDIIVQENTPYTTYGDWKVSNFLDIWENKCNLVENLNSDKSHYMRESAFKHTTDINFLKLNFLI